MVVSFCEFKHILLDKKYQKVLESTLYTKNSCLLGIRALNNIIFKTMLFYNILEEKKKYFFETSGLGIRV